jgi:DNA-binding response OmpR family regulator
MTETLLIVDPDAASQRAMVDALKAGRYRTLTAGGFRRGIQLLETSRPDLLITVVRLGQFNGVHLVVLGRSKDPRMAALVVDDRRDTVLEREAMQAGATAYLTKPLSPADLLRRVAEALANRERRWWSRTPLASTVIVGIGPGQARLLDISYGGFRLESGTQHLHHVLKLDLPILGLSVNAKRVWSRRTPVDTVWSCGAALVAPTDSEGTQRWRRLVDTVRAGVTFSSRLKR